LVEVDAGPGGQRLGGRHGNRQGQGEGTQQAPVLSRPLLQQPAQQAEAAPLGQRAIGQAQQRAGPEHGSQMRRHQALLPQMSWEIAAYQPRVWSAPRRRVSRPALRELAASDSFTAISLPSCTRYTAATEMP